MSEPRVMEEEGVLGQQGRMLQRGMDRLPPISYADTSRWLALLSWSSWKEVCSSVPRKSLAA